MSRRSVLARAALVACALGVTAAQAGGPIGLCNFTPLKYPGAGAVTFNYDPGVLGTRSKPQADAIVTAASALWTNVPTATITLSRGSDLPEDVTSANYTTYFNNFNDGLNPVIYDSDGSILDLLLGAGSHTSVGGFATSGSAGSPCRYTEGRAIINGAVSLTDNVLTMLVAHELGHLIGLDHSQLDSAQGLVASNYPLMYPLAQRTSATLHEDEAAAVTALYPDTNVAATYGTLRGTFTLADTLTPIRGANIWARNVANGKVFSAVSDFLMLNSGSFSLLLPPGTYTLHAEAIHANFNAGSRVGPYSRNSTDLSFQAPLYNGATAMAPLTLGVSNAVEIPILAGCVDNVAFRLDGTGLVSGDCGDTIPPSPSARLANLSTRGQVLTGNDAMIAGFIIGGSASKSVVINVAGPSLVPFGIANALSNPTLSLVRSSDQAVLNTNDNWQAQSNAGDVAALQASGFQPNHALEPALIATLAPGAYTAIVQGVNGTTGVGLVGVFEVDHPEIPLLNISTRGQVLTGNDVMIAGFVIQGTTSQTVVVNVAGPSLVPFGIANALMNPTLSLVRSSDNAVIATNDNWQTQAAGSVAAIQASGFQPNNALEPAVIANLAPGAYTAIVSGVGGTTGVGLVGVFKAP
jgi:hypothetical protein